MSDHRKESEAQATETINDANKNSEKPLSSNSFSQPDTLYEKNPPDQALQEKVEALEKELSITQSQLKKAEEALLLEKANAINISRQYEKRIQDASKYGATVFLKSLLVMVDNLERSIESIESYKENATQEDPLADQIYQGVKMTLTEFNNLMKKHEVTVLNPLGEAFDPNWHEAISTQPSDKAKSNTVLQVIKKGYVLNGRLIRAANVIVSS